MSPTPRNDGETPHTGYQGDAEDIQHVSEVDNKIKQPFNLYRLFRCF